LTAQLKGGAFWLFQSRTVPATAKSTQYHAAGRGSLYHAVAETGMYDRVLVATDGSSGTMETLEHAASIALDNEAQLHGLYVVDRRHFLAADKEDQDDVKQSLEEEGEVALDDIELRGEEAALETVTAMREGIPYKTIIDYADTEEIDLVVMGTHGRTGRDRVAKLGSVTERVVENAPVPVLVVHID